MWLPCLCFSFTSFVLCLAAMIPGPLNVQQHLRQIRHIFGNVRVMKLKMIGMEFVLHSLDEMKSVVDQMDSQLCHLVKILEQDGYGQQTKPFPNKEAMSWTLNRVAAWGSIVVPAEKAIVDDAEVEHPLQVQADDYQSDAMEEEFKLCGEIFGEHSGTFQDCEENKMMYRAKPSATSSNNEWPCVWTWALVTASGKVDVQAAVVRPLSLGANTSVPTMTHHLLRFHYPPPSAS